MPTVVEERNKAIVQRWIDEVFNAGQLTAVDELKVSSYLDWTPLPSPYQQVDLPVSGIKDALPEWLSGLPDFHFSSDRMIAESDFVVCLGHWSAHHMGTYKGHAPTNKRLGGTRIDIFRVAGDKMVEHWGCGNELAFLQLVGALEAAENGGASRTDEDVAREFVERVLGNRDVAAVADLIDPSAVDHSGQALSLLALFEGFPDLVLTPTDLAVEGESVTVTSAVSGTHEGYFMGIPPTGKEVRGKRVDRFRLSGGKIVESWRESDDWALAQQLNGAQPQPRSAEPDRRHNENGRTSSQRRKEVVRQFLDHVANGKDFAAVSDFFVGDVTDHLAGSLTAYLTFAAFPDFQLNTEHVIAEGDMVSVLATFTGTHDRQLMGLAPTHKGVSGRVAFSFRMDEAKIAETWAEIEPWTLLQQLGSPAFA
jgi:predicted ester cyclase